MTQKEHAEYFRFNCTLRLLNLEYSIDYNNLYNNIVISFLKKKFNAILSKYKKQKIDQVVFIEKRDNVEFYINVAEENSIIFSSLMNVSEISKYLEKKQEKNKYIVFIADGRHVLYSSSKNKDEAYKLPVNQIEISPLFFSFIDDSGNTTCIEKTYVNEVKETLSKNSIQVDHIMSQQQLAVQELGSKSENKELKVTKTFNSYEISAFYLNDRIVTKCLKNANAQCQDLKNEYILASKKILKQDLLEISLESENILNHIDDSECKRTNIAKNNLRYGFTVGLYIFLLPIVILMSYLHYSTKTQYLKSENTLKVLVPNNLNNMNLNRSVSFIEKKCACRDSIYNHKNRTEASISLINLLIDADNHIKKETGLNQNFTVTSLDIKETKAPSEKSIGSPYQYSFTIKVKDIEVKNVAPLIDKLNSCKLTKNSVKLKNSSNDQSTITGTMSINSKNS